MADDNSADIENLDQLYRETMAPPPSTGGTYNPSQRGWASLLGEALGGGASGGNTEDREIGGRQALMSAGINMLLNSGYRNTPMTFGQIAATGLGGAQQSLGESEQRAGQRAQLAQDAQKERLERIAKAIPILKFKEELKESARVRNTPPPTFGGDTPAAPNPAGQAAVAMTPFVAKNLPEGVSVEEDQLVRTVIGEAGGEPPQGQQAVASVVKNRMAGGKSAQDVIFAPNQFEPWNNPAVRAKLEGIDPRSPQYQQILNSVVRPVMAGTAKDPTGGATHFYSPTAQKALGREPPAWGAGTPKAVIGRHNFYSPDGAPQTAAAAPPAATPHIGADGKPTGLVVKPDGSVGTPGGGFPPAAPRPPPAPAARVAGPGAAPGGPVAPPSPEVAGDVGAIVAGMTQPGGADPGTLAPGQGRPVPGAQVAEATPPGAPPAVSPAIPPQARPPGIPVPGEDFQTYRQRNPLRPSPEQEAAFRPQPDAAAMAQLTAAGKALLAGWPSAKTSAEQNAIRDKLSAIEIKRADLMREATEKATERRRAWEKEGTDHQFKVWDGANTAERTFQQKLREDAAKHEQGLQTEQVKTDGQIRVEGAKQEGAYAYGELKKFSDRRNAIRTNMDNLDMLRTWSDTAGPSTAIDNMIINGRSGRDIMVQYGLGDRAQREKWGAQQAFGALINKTVLGLKEGISMGPMTDKDLDFLRDMSVKQLQDPTTRSDIIAYMERFEFRQKAYIDNVERLWDGGKGMSWGKALRAAEEGLPDLVPSVPENWAALPDSAKREFLVANNIKHGSLLRQPPPKDENGKVTGPGRLSRYKLYEDK